jgi:O-antigen/teichoic acid export membrane protein
LLTFIILRAVIELIGTVLVIGFTRAKLPRAAAPALPWRTIAQAARPYWIGDLAVITYMRSDTAILSLVGGSAIMGFFGPASSLVIMTYIISSALQVLVIPLLSRTHAQGHYRRFQQLALLQLSVQGLAGLGVTLSIIGLAPFIIFQVFGPAYAYAIPILQFLSPVIFFKFLNFGLGAWLTSSGQQAWRTKVQLVFAGVNALTTIVGVLTHGLIGALVVDVLTEACLMLGYLWAVWFTWLQPQLRPQLEISPVPGQPE